MVKIEEGKYYRLKNGVVVGPLQRIIDDTYPWRIVGMSGPTVWTKEGWYERMNKYPEKNISHEVTITDIEPEYEPVGWFDNTEEDKDVSSAAS